MWKQILKSAREARRLHSKQFRKHSEPYFNHPKAVARILWNKGHRNPDVICGAFLHDTIEDCGIDVNYIWDKFGLNVAKLVYALTKQKNESEENYYNRIKQCGNDAMQIKIADREHNNSQIVYLHQEHPTVAKAKIKTELMKKVFEMS